MNARPLLASLVCPVACAVLTACGGSGNENSAGISQSALAASSLTGSGPGSSPATRMAPVTFVESKAVFSGPRANYSIVKSAGGYTVTDNVGQDGVTALDAAITRFEFSDVAVNPAAAALSKELNAADLQSLIELYIAFFNRVPEADGLAYWIGRLKAGATIEQLCDSFYQAAIAYPQQTGYSPAMSPADFVRLIYSNVLGRSGATAPPEGDVQYWAGRIASGSETRGTLIKAMLASAHTFTGDATWGWVARLLDNKYLVGHYFGVQQSLNYPTPALSIERTMAIAAAVTPESTAAAMNLVPVAAGSAPLDPGLPPPLGVDASAGLRARFNNPGGIAFDAAGNLYIADTLNYTIRKMTPAGEVTTVAGAARQRGGTDGAGDAARFSGPSAVSVDGAGNLYVADGLAVRKISPAGAVSTLAGAFEMRGYQDGAGATARFDFLQGIAADGTGGAYVSDNQNYLIRRVAADGQTTTVAGMAAMRGGADGGPGSATLRGPTGMTLGADGNLLVMDALIPGPHLSAGSAWLRKVTPAGAVSTLAGSASNETASGTLAYGLSVTSDAAGNAYIAIPGGIRKVSAAGAISDIVAGSAEIVSPRGIALDRAGNLYVSDAARMTISKVTPQGQVSVVAGRAGESGAADSTP
jgi:sugar lactone lactonase YvrE